LKGSHNRDDVSPGKSSQIRKLFIGASGFTVLLIGMAMIVLPGPATLVIPLGLGILATEFLWAQRLVKKGKGQLQKNVLRHLRWFKQRYL
jgi:tellurite resistance protein TerC